MRPEQHKPHDPYWTHDIILAQDVPLQDGPSAAPTMVHAKLHVSDETYPRHHSRSEIVPILDEAGTRRYVMMHHYVLVPDLRLQLDLYPQPTRSGAIGEVVSSHVEGPRPLQIGTAQAWYYPTDHTIVLWELLLHRPFRPATVPPAEDRTYLALWRGFEQQLISLFPDAQQIATPSWDPEYPTEQWHHMLTALWLSARHADNASGVHQAPSCRRVLALSGNLPIADSNTRPRVTLAPHNDPLRVVWSSPCPVRDLAPARDAALFPESSPSPMHFPARATGATVCPLTSRRSSITVELSWYESLSQRV